MSLKAEAAKVFASIVAKRNQKMGVETGKNTGKSIRRTSKKGIENQLWQGP